MDSTSTMPSAHARPALKCIASTGQDFCKSIRDCCPDGIRERGRDTGSETNFFREAEVSRDASCIITHNEDHALRTFALGQVRHDPSSLRHNAEYRSPTNIQSFAVNPRFDVQDPATTVVLCASADIPIASRNALDYSIVHATYPFIHKATERHLSASSLLITPDATRFVASADGLFCVFDCSRDRGEPIATQRLFRRRHRDRIAEGGMKKAMASALSLSGDDVLAIGTTAREIALFDNQGIGQRDAFFTIPTSSSGSGVSALEWSPCGRYLFVAERRSHSMVIYDIRGAGRLLATLQGRRACTNQKLGFSLRTTDAGTDVWAGGTDGVVRAWVNPTASSGDIGPDHSYDMHQAPVSSTVWDETGSFLTTCSGERSTCLEFADQIDRDEVDHTPRSPDNTLKVWTSLW